MLGAGREDMNQYWGRHRSDVEDQPVAQLEDLEWADGIAFVRRTGARITACPRRESDRDRLRRRPAFPQ
jgi:hypothetical protein